MVEGLRTIVAGVDGSPASLGALRWAARLAVAAEARVVVVAVYVADQDQLLHWDEAHELAQKKLEHEWCEPAWQEGAAYESELIDGHAGAAVLEAAASHHADLVVIASRGQGGFPGLLMGSVADYLAHHINVPLAVVPPDGMPSGFDAVMALDGSAGARRAAEWWGPIAAALGTETTAVHVVVPAEPLVRSSDARVARARGLLEGQWTEPLRVAGAGAAARVLENRHPAHAVLEFVRTSSASLLVMGTRDVGGMRTMRLGGVTMQVLHHTGTPVIIVPAER